VTVRRSREGALPGIHMRNHGETPHFSDGAEDLRLTGIHECG
jgi:hypothetical protein